MIIDILLPAFCVSVVLLGIHSYFGLRIIQRGIIFTDLAIGQMAAFGAAISLLFFDGGLLYGASLTFAIIGGLLIALALRVTRHLEAVIGLIYAIGISGAFVLLTKSAHGMEKFQNLLAYDILFTRLEDVYRVALLYLALGMVIYISDKKAKGFLKEIMFFLTFAATVTSSVEIGGVLVVFAILLSPALITIQLGAKSYMPEFIRRCPLVTAWMIGIVINTASIYVSYRFDLPTGYTLVFLHAFIAVLSSFVFIQKGGALSESIKEDMGN
jgi:zinc/manganese transport system permease protein